MWRTHSCLLVGVGVSVLLAQPSTAWAQAGPNLVIAMSCVTPSASPQIKDDHSAVSTRTLVVVVRPSESTTDRL
jgi:hypothetical protein